MADSPRSEAVEPPDATVDSGADSTPPKQQRRSNWPAKKLEIGSGQQFVNRLIGRLAKFGLVPHTYQLTTVGRKTGCRHSTPVSLVEHGDQRWLVAPYGPVPWVLNARAAGRVTLQRHRKTDDFSVTELSFTEAGPILREYLSFARATKQYFIATKNSPVEEFIKEADRHPVFALTPIKN